MKLHENDFYEVEADVLRFDNFDDAVECCADLNTPFFVDAENKSRSSGLFVLMQWLSRNSPCTEREFALILAAMSAEGMYYTVHSSDDVSQPFRCLPFGCRETAGLGAVCPVIITAYLRKNGDSVETGRDYRVTRNGGSVHFCR